MDVMTCGSFEHMDVDTTLGGWQDIETEGIWCPEQACGTQQSRMVHMPRTSVRPWSVRWEKQAAILFEPLCLYFSSPEAVPYLWHSSHPFFRFYLFIHERHRERGRDIGRERSRLHAGSLMLEGSQDPGITTWTEGRCSTTEPPRCSGTPFFYAIMQDLAPLVVIKFGNWSLFSCVFSPRNFLFLHNLHRRVRRGSVNHLIH